MRTLSVLFLLVVFTASMASAELLTTASTLGQGKWAFLGAGVQDMNLSEQKDATLTTLGGYVGYGLLDNLDIYLQYGSATSSGLETQPGGLLPPGLKIEVTGSGYQLAAKYRILKEGEALPVSVAIAALYKSATLKTKIPDAAYEDSANGTQLAGGIGISKVIIPFVPYLGIAYRSDKEESTQVSTQLDLTVGTAIAWSMQGAVLLEYTNQSITPDGGSVYTSGQMAVGVVYKI